MTETVEADADKVTVEALAVMVIGVQDGPEDETAGAEVVVAEVVVAEVVAGELEVVAMQEHADEYLEVP